MSQGALIGLVSIAGALILFGAGVRRRRLPRETLLRYAAIWAAVFALLFLGAYWIGGTTPP